MGTIDHIETDDLAAIIAGLVREGLRFTVVPMPSGPIASNAGQWQVVLNGGH